MLKNLKSTAKRSAIKALAKSIASVLTDYHNFLQFQITPERVIDWVCQFAEEDRVFLLEEFLHLLRQGIYINQASGKKLLINRIESLASKFGFQKPVSFLENASFLQLQPQGKSQDHLLHILEEELVSKYGIDLARCSTKSKKYAIYIDDVLATGGTIFKDCLNWLNTADESGITYLNKVVNNETILIISVFCLHKWNNIAWRLKMELNSDAILKKIMFYADYEIENHPRFHQQKLNFVYPVKHQPVAVLDYFNQIEGQRHGEIAFRADHQPSTETLFSSAANRIRFENILLLKGIELLQKVQTLKPNHRPLGVTFPSYKTLGTGTMFFTWRNISNTCPVVFWWDAGVWLPLFPLKGREIGNPISGT